MKNKGAQALFNALKAKGYKKMGSEVDNSAPKILMEMAKNGVEMDMVDMLEKRTYGGTPMKEKQLGGSNTFSGEY